MVRQHACLWAVSQDIFPWQGRAGHGKARLGAAGLVGAIRLLAGGITSYFPLARHGGAGLGRAGHGMARHGNTLTNERYHWTIFGQFRSK